MLKHRAPSMAPESRIPTPCPPRNEPQQPRSHATVARILDATQRIAEMHGVSAVNMRRVARSARVSDGTVYRYFATREALLEAYSLRSWGASVEGFFNVYESVRGQPLERGAGTLIAWSLGEIASRVRARRRREVEDSLLGADARDSFIQQLGAMIEPIVERNRAAFQHEDPLRAARLALRLGIRMANEIGRGPVEEQAWAVERATHMLLFFLFGWTVAVPPLHATKRDDPSV